MYMYMYVCSYVLFVNPLYQYLRAPNYTQSRAKGELLFSLHLYFYSRMIITCIQNMFNRLVRPLQLNKGVCSGWALLLPTEFPPSPLFLLYLSLNLLSGSICDSVICGPGVFLSDLRTSFRCP